MSNVLWSSYNIRFYTFSNVWTLYLWTFLFAQFTHTAMRNTTKISANNNFFPQVCSSPTSLVRINKICLTYEYTVAHRQNWQEIKYEMKMMCVNLYVRPILMCSMFDVKHVNSILISIFVALHRFPYATPGEHQRHNIYCNVTNQRNYIRYNVNSRILIIIIIGPSLSIKVISIKKNFILIQHVQG